jgi:hypothetical protein
MPATLGKIQKTFDSQTNRGTKGKKSDHPREVGWQTEYSDHQAIDPTGY